ncbi:hypothetical protein ACVIGV_004361 [Rhizobium leguminosarum]
MTVISEPFSMDHVDIHSDNFGDDSLLRAGLKLNHLRMIVAIEDSGQISAAAEVLNISQRRRIADVVRNGINHQDIAL